MDTHTAEQRHKNMQAINVKIQKSRFFSEKNFGHAESVTEKIPRMYLGNLILYLNKKRLRFFATANFGTDTTGKLNVMK